MALAPGTRLGPYDITAQIGSGGMGEVYRAVDSNLKRSVAIKVLLASVAADADRVARFQREAEVLATLNHPNIAHIHGLEKSDGTLALVMELVEGPTLADRIAHGALPIDDALPIAKQIAEALEAAHEHGIIHRDLKPSNIKVRSDGTVKVLDFGLAKAMEPGASSLGNSMSPTLLTPAMTQAGLILGTAAYMSPEQAKGRSVDRRADVWAFGAVLFEMVTGRQPFSGETVSETLAEVMKSEPAWQAIPASVPARITRLIRQCLVKDPRQRVRDIGDVRLALDGAFDTTGPESATTAASPDERWTRTAAIRLAAAAAVLASIGAGGGAWWLTRPTQAASAPLARLTITLPANQRLGNLDQPVVAVSPQGTLVAYVGTSGDRDQLFVRAIDSVESKALAGTEGALTPFFSPDGQWIGFFAQGKLKKVSVAAGTTQTLCDAPSPRGGSWAEGSIYFAANANSGISKVSADGGMPTDVTTLDRGKGEVSHRWPQVLPGGRALLFDVWTGPGVDEKRIEILRLDSEERIVVAQGAATGRYASGHVIYARKDDLFTVPFDVDNMRVSGQAVRLSSSGWRGSEGNQYAVSDNGVFVSVAGSPARYERRLVWVSRDGRVEPVAAPAGNFYGNAVISPDGRRAAVDIEAETVGVWLFDFARVTLTPVTTGQGSSQAPRWTPDGTRLIYRGTRMGSRNLWWKTVDSAAGEERVTTGEGVQTAGSWSADGRWLVYYDTDPATGFDVWALPSGGDRNPLAVVRTPFGEQHPRLSPDGRWLAYTSNESGRVEVLVQSFPEPAGRTQISTNGGIEPVWSRDGRELFYLAGDAMMAVEIRTSPTFTAGAPRKLFEGRYVTSPNSVASYDVSADGQRFLRVQPMHPDPPSDQIQVTLNWFEELKRLASAK